MPSIFLRLLHVFKCTPSDIVHKLVSDVDLILLILKSKLIF